MLNFIIFVFEKSYLKHTPMGYTIENWEMNNMF